MSPLGCSGGRNADGVPKNIQEDISGTGNADSRMLRYLDMRRGNGPLLLWQNMNLSRKQVKCQRGLDMTGVELGIEVWHKMC